MTDILVLLLILNALISIKRIEVLERFMKSREWLIDDSVSREEVEKLMKEEWSEALWIIKK